MHGNGVALDAVLADLRSERLDGLLCLGDLAQGGPEPDRVVDAVRRLDVAASFVLGNADAFLLEPNAGEEPVTELQLATRAWSVERLGDERLAFLRAFRPTVELELDGGATLLAFHGSPRSYDAIVLPTASEAEFRALLGPTNASFLCGGHTHVQWTRRLDAATFFNPGSVGFSRDEPLPEGELRYDAWACYAILTVTSSAAEIAFRRLRFDPREVVAAVERSGIPHAADEVRRWREARRLSST